MDTSSQFKPTRVTFALLVGLLCGLAAVGALWIDVRVARFFSAQTTAGDIRRLFDLSEVFAHGWGILSIVLTIAVLDPRSRPKLYRVVFCAYGAGLLALGSKYLIPRVRPNVFDPSGSVWDSFSAARVLAEDGVELLADRAVQSMPSGHAAAAVGLAFALAWLYPRGRWLFALFALLACVQRVHSQAHFASDVLAGATIGCVMAALCLSERLLGKHFTRREEMG
jgi:membrane-associated phospholipid phosphatase